MPVKVVVLGAGYAGASAIKTLEATVDDVDLTWISEHDYHLVLHEAHRLIRNPTARDRIALPIEAIKSDRTRFVQGEVVDLHVEDRTIELADGTAVDYDYALVALGSQTAYYGIPGMNEHALTLKGLDDALAIHEAVVEAARAADPDEPATVAIGGAGLSGVQSAGEVAAYRDEHDAPLEVVLLEALPEILPGQGPGLQQAVRKRLEAAGVEIRTDDPVVEVDADRIHFDVGEPFAYDALVWTGGITGRDALSGTTVEKEHNRLLADATFRTSDERVFAIGDAGVIAQNDVPAPPTAQAAWQAADVAAANVARAIEGEPLEPWRFADKGTLVSIGDEAVAHGVDALPVETFGSLPAEFLKKFVAARWIADVTSWSRARAAWKYL